MKRILLSTCLLLAAVLPARAQIVIESRVLACGGAIATDGERLLAGTLGESITGQSADADWWLGHGFWHRSSLIPTGIGDGEILPPATFDLAQNYPNPFNPRTTIRFALPRSGRVTLKLFDIRGRELRTLLDTELPAGYHETVLDAGDLASGVYFTRMAAGDFRATKRLMLLK